MSDRSLATYEKVTIERRYVATLDDGTRRAIPRYYRSKWPEAEVQERRIIVEAWPEDVLLGSLPDDHHDLIDREVVLT